MKKIPLSAMIAIAVTFTACTKKIDASNVPDPVKTSFAKQFPEATPKWEKEDGKYEAGFMLDGNNMSAVFDANGSMEESEMDVKVSDLPQTILAYVKDHYKNKSIKEAAKITLANGTVNYEAKVKGKDLVFDAAGKFLKVDED